MKYSAHYYCQGCNTKVPPFHTNNEAGRDYASEEEDPQLFCPNCGCNTFEAYSRKIPFSPVKRNKEEWF